MSRLFDVMARHVERGVPGTVTLVSRGDDLVVDAVGALALGDASRMRRDTIFRIASMTKPLVAAAAMMLVEDCVLRLDDPVDAFLPELANRKVLARIDSPLTDTVPAKRSITLRDLLTFRAGLGMVMAPPDTHPIQRAMSELRLGSGPPDPPLPPAPDEWMRRLGTLPLMHQPGERWMYNTGSDILAVLIARAAGKPLEAFLRERLTGPLGMEDTSFHVPAGKRERFATSYWTDAATGALTPYDAPDGKWSSDPAFPSGAGGLVSTVDDYLAFGRMLLGGGRHGRERVLSRASVELMTTDHLAPEQRAGAGMFLEDHRGWGFGMSVVTRRCDVQSVGTFGWEGGLGTSWASDPREDLVAILMTQAAWTSPAAPAIYADFWTTVYRTLDD